MKKAYMNPEIELVEVAPLEMISLSGDPSQPTQPSQPGTTAPETPDDTWG